MTSCSRTRSKAAARGNLSRRNFRDICERAGLGQYEPAPKKPKGRPGPAKKQRFKPAHRMYDLRDLLLKSGVNVKVVSEILGHASVRITLDIYSYVLPDMQDTAVEAMEAMFGREKGDKKVTAVATPANSRQ